MVGRSVGRLNKMSNGFFFVSENSVFYFGLLFGCLYWNWVDEIDLLKCILLMPSWKDLFILWWKIVDTAIQKAIAPAGQLQLLYKSSLNTVNKAISSAIPNKSCLSMLIATIYISTVYYLAFNWLVDHKFSWPDIEWKSFPPLSTTKNHVCRI